VPARTPVTAYVVGLFPGIVAEICPVGQAGWHGACPYN